MKDWNIEAMTGYEPKTTFYTDFSIAERFGVDGIMDTYSRAFRSWKKNVEYITELVMVLNWKIFEHQDNGLFCRIYQKLWLTLDGWCQENLKGDDLAYYYRTTD